MTMNPIQFFALFAAVHFMCNAWSMGRHLFGPYPSFWRAAWSRPICLLHILVSLSVVTSLILLLSGVSWTQTSSFLESLSK